MEETKNINQSYVGKRSEVAEQVPKSAVKILDVGCSNGELGVELLNQNPERTVYGIEYDRDLFLEASSRLSKVFHQDLECFDWQGEIGDDSFDCIIFSDVLEHIREPSVALSNAIRYLNPNGCVIISLPNIRHITALYSIFIRGTFPVRGRGIFDRTHLRWFTLADSFWLCKKVGLSPELVECNLRIQDLPTGKLNKYTRYLKPFQGLYLIKHFFSYQFVIKATKA